jgi:Cu(I)/Ag(I) efflux system protein CusF
MPTCRLLSSLLVSLSLGLPLAALAQSDHEAHHAVVAAAPSQAALSDGVIRKIDRQASEVTIAHGPLVNLGMPPMTMTFHVKTPALLAGVKEGSKVRFVAESVNGELTVVALQLAK